MTADDQVWRPRRRLRVLATDTAIQDGQIPRPTVGEVGRFWLLFNEVPPDACLEPDRALNPEGPDRSHMRAAVLIDGARRSRRQTPTRAHPGRRCRLGELRDVGLGRAITSRSPHTTTTGSPRAESRPATARSLFCPTPRRNDALLAGSIAPGSGARCPAREVVGESRSAVPSQVCQSGLAFFVHG